MLEAPGKDSDISQENFEKSVVVLTISIVSWIEYELDKNPAKDESPEVAKKAALLLQATDHLRQYGITGARVACIVTLTVASLWGQSQSGIGIAKEDDLKRDMSWVMKSPAVQTAIQETFKPLDQASKHDAENFARGSENIINAFVRCSLAKFSCQADQQSADFVVNNIDDLKDLRNFFDAVDEGGLSYIPKVLELSVSSAMNSKIFDRESATSYSDYYAYTVQLLQDVFELEVA
tara:strand:+ start:2502 stop:3206 length:705 start_codon:yes stop_codon:yes gene_type:complete